VLVGSGILDALDCANHHAWPEQPFPRCFLLLGTARTGDCGLEDHIFAEEVLLETEKVAPVDVVVRIGHCVQGPGAQPER